MDSGSIDRGNRALLEVVDLTVSFETGEGRLLAVRGVGFDLRRGESLGIVGESGSGKSVTVTAALGLLDRTAAVGGTVRLAGRELSVHSAAELRAVRGKGVAMIFQEPNRSFDPIYSIGKTFEETLRTKQPGLSREACRARAVELLTEVHIPRAEERLRNFPHQFSGGMLQRIMIALALANDPEVLVADEPTTALDVTIQAQIVGLLAELRRRRGLSLIFISHDLRLVAQIADRIMVMYGGVVLELGETARVIAEPHSPYTRALLNAVPAWGSHYTEGGLATIPGNVPDPVRPPAGCPFEPRCPHAEARCRDRLPPLRPREGTTGPARSAPEAPMDGGRGPGSYRCIVEGVKP